ncbi:hypothetical protein PtA15_4A364 [Puccinia triticina]|uniref:Uncharacterized protein n=1 Tax=Puccinia triticina TaxID=208348 RepID=A0ABY7CFP5_9BASI|nr:uncharacterized protein PtA15_4A364 [Puccinia triticina]WAQ83914.1 hypothetical protein PtA15_4A364 [Puccinia triticina]
MDGFRNPRGGGRSQLHKAPTPQSLHPSVPRCSLGSSLLPTIAARSLLDYQSSCKSPSAPQHLFPQVKKNQHQEESGVVFLAKEPHRHLAAELPLNAHAIVAVTDIAVMGAEKIS